MVVGGSDGGQQFNKPISRLKDTPPVPSKTEPKIARDRGSVTPGAGYEQQRKELSPTVKMVTSMVNSTATDPARTDPKGAPGTYVNQDRPLFDPKKGPTAADVVQSKALGDCYLVASLAALARQNPGFVREMIVNTGPDKYKVRFFQDDGKGNQVEQWIEVDDDLPTVDGKLAGAGAGQGESMWVALVEKAYAKRAGSYDAIGNGGHASIAMTALTGKRAAQVDLGQAKTDTFLDDVHETVAAGRLVVADTPRDKAVIFKDIDGKENKTGATFGHSYTVVGVSRGYEAVNLRDPYGKVLIVAVDEFLRVFKVLNVGQT